MPAVTCSLLSPIFKESQADWSASGTAVVAGTSILARPDALSPDYQVAFANGPIETGSVDFGLTYAAWRVSTTYVNQTQSVLLQRQNDAGTDWRTAVPLFSFTGSNPIQEIDLAFSGDGRAVVTGNRLTHATASISGSDVWLYWFNPFSSSFVWQNFGSGKTPRLVLDQPDLPSTADVLVMYIRDDLGRVYYRQQRDAYATERWIPVPIPSSVSGTLVGSLSGAFQGSFTGSAAGTFNDYLSGSFYGTVIGAASGATTGSYVESFTNLSFSGSILGTFTGSFTGTVNGTLNGGVINQNTSSFGTYAANMTGYFTGSGNGTVYRPRTSFTNQNFLGAVTGTITGSMNGITPGAIIFSTGSGYFSGSVSGNMAGDIVGFPTGTQKAFFETYLEDAVKLRDSRVCIFYSQRNILNASYQLKRFETVLYPFLANFEQISGSTSYVTASLFVALMTHSIFDVEAFQSFSCVPYTASLFDIVLRHTVYNKDAMVSASAAYLSSSLYQLILTASFAVSGMHDAMVSASAAYMSSSMATIVILQNISGSDAFVSSSATFTSGSLV
jgi:outer membrane lipoprotein SlyB